MTGCLTVGVGGGWGGVAKRERERERELPGLTEFRSCVKVEVAVLGFPS